METEQLIQAIKKAGMRVTMPRRAICRVLAESEAPFMTVSEIRDRVAETSGLIDSSTAYRTLEELQRLGFVHHVSVGNQAGTWHLARAHDHQHLICEGCGTQLTIPVTHLQSFLAEIQEEYGFEPSTHHFAILGYCADCKDREETAD